MAVVRSLTAEKIYAIEAATVVDAVLRNDHLILIQHDGTEIDVGNIRGPVGASGDHHTLINLDQDDHLQYVPASGSRPMTGQLQLSGDPTQKLSAAPKQYVDSDGGVINLDSSILSGPEVHLRYTGRGFTTWGDVVRSTNFLVLPKPGWYRMGFHAGIGSVSSAGTYRTMTIGTDTDSTPGGDGTSGAGGPLGQVVIGSTITQPIITTGTTELLVMSAQGISYVRDAGTKVGVWLRNDGGVNVVAYATLSVELLREAV